MGEVYSQIYHDCLKWGAISFCHDGKDGDFWSVGAAFGHLACGTSFDVVFDELF
jgi:hypothetical protein